MKPAAHSGPKLMPNVLVTRPLTLTRANCENVELSLKVRTENSSLNYRWREQGTAPWQSLYPDTRYTFKIRKASNIVLLQNKKAQHKRKDGGPWKSKAQMISCWREQRASQVANRNSAVGFSLRGKSRRGKNPGAAWDVPLLLRESSLPIKCACCPEAKTLHNFF